MAQKCFLTYILIITRFEKTATPKIQQIRLFWGETLYKAEKFLDHSYYYARFLNGLIILLILISLTFSLVKIFMLLLHNLKLKFTQKL